MYVRMYVDGYIIHNHGKLKSLATYKSQFLIIKSQLSEVQLVLTMEK